VMPAGAGEVRRARRPGRWNIDLTPRSRLLGYVRPVFVGCSFARIRRGGLEHGTSFDVSHRAGG
jgi:hypothetical protein